MKKDKRKENKPANGVTRRGFLAGVGTAVVSSAVIGPGISTTAEAQNLRAARPDALEDIL
jgi:hypothetical protein